MPFDSTNAATAGRKGGKIGSAIRWKDKDPSTTRNKRISLALSQAELDMIDDVAARKKLSRAELIIKAVEKYT